MLWEETREQEVEVLHGDGESIGFLLQQDARVVAKQHIKDLIKSVPQSSLAVLDPGPRQARGKRNHLSDRQIC